MVYISEDRQKYGLIVPMSVSGKYHASPPQAAFQENRASSIPSERRISGEYMERLAIKAPDGDFVVNNLSGGNQQKVSVAKALATELRGS